MLVLIGYRGTGKTTTARELAQRLGWECVDLDEEIEQAAGKPIAAIFAEEGEAAFRDEESAALARSIERGRGAGGWLVLATGGGIVLREGNRRLLRDACEHGGCAAWLRASPETIHRRMAADVGTTSRRPNLTPQGGLREIVSLLAERTPLYEQCATLKIDTEGKTPLQVADEVLAALPRQCEGPAA